MDEQTRYEEARKRVEEIKGFYVHLASYVLINAALILINLLTSPNNLWFIWALFGWGSALLCMPFPYTAACGASPGKNARSRKSWKKTNIPALPELESLFS